MIGETPQQQATALRTALNNFIQSRQILLHFLSAAADKLDKHHKNVKITKVVTGSTGTAGTIIGIAGIIFAPPTAGLSLLLIAGGGALAATSGLAHVGSGAVEYVLGRSYINKLDTFSQADEATFFILAGYLQTIIENLRARNLDNNTTCKTVLDILNELSSAANLGCSIVRVTRVGISSAVTIRIFSAASMVLGVVTLPFQIIDLAVDGHALHNNERSKTATEFRQLVQDLTMQVNNVQRGVEAAIHQLEQGF